MQSNGTPGTPNCIGDSLSALAHTYGGITHYASRLWGNTNVASLQSAISSYCSQ